MGGSALEVAGFGLSQADKMALATVDLLRQSEKLMAWTGNKINRADLLNPDFSGVAPFILVGAESWTTAFELGCSKKTAAIDTLLVFEVPRPEVSDDQPTIMAAIEEWERVIYNNAQLKVERFGAQTPLARKLEEFAPIQLDAGEKDSGGIRFVLTLQATYSLGWNPEFGRFEA